MDIYIELNPSTGPLLPITIQGLQYTQASKYVSFAFNPNNDNPPPGFTVYVTAAGSMQPIISESLNPATAGAVRTLVLTDVQDGKIDEFDFPGVVRSRLIWESIRVENVGCPSPAASQRTHVLQVRERTLRAETRQAAPLRTII